MNISIRTCCILLLLALSFSFSFIFDFSSAASADNDRELKSAAVVVGTVYCDTCFHQVFSELSHFISGASVAVECEGGFKKAAKTNRHGVFRFRLPAKVIKSCSVKLIRSSEPFCAVASSATSNNGLHLKSKRNNGLSHVFSAGFFTFKPMNQPELCNQELKPALGLSKKHAQSTSSSSLFFFFPPIPFLPSPPNIGGVPLPPNPLLPPPSLLPPLIPSPPPSLLPPVFPSPPPSLFPPLTPSPPPSLLPPLPSLTPSPPPPPPSLFPPFPFPLPLPPNPLFPGNPPQHPEEETSP